MGCMQVQRFCTSQGCHELGMSWDVVMQACVWSSVWPVPAWQWGRAVERGGGACGSWLAHGHGLGWVQRGA